MPVHPDSMPRKAYCLDSLNNTQRLPRSIYCSITHMPMQDPVVASDGFSYEREALRRWLDERNTSPMTGLAISKDVIPNHTLRNTITELVEEEGVDSIEEEAHADRHPQGD